MLFLEDAPQGNISIGPAATASEFYAANRDDQLYANGSIMKSRAVRKGWEDKLSHIEKVTGEKLPLPNFDGVFMPVFGGVDPEQMKDYQSKIVSDYMQVTRRIEELAQQHPEYYEKWMTDPESSGHQASRAADKRLRDVSSRNQSWLNSIAGFAGGFAGGMQDPINLGLAPFGAGKAVGQGVYNVVRAGVVNGLIGAAGEATIQPLSQQWRKEAGLKYGWGEAATNVGMAFAFGFGIDAGVRGAWRGGKLLKGKAQGAPSQSQADAFYSGLKGLDEASSEAQAWEVIQLAASQLPERNPLHKALLKQDHNALLEAVRAVDPERAEGLAQSRAEFGHGNADIVDDELRGAANWLEGEDGRPEMPGLHDADDSAAQSQAARHVFDQDEPPAQMPKPQKDSDIQLQDGAAQPLAEKGVIDGRPYSSQKVRPSSIETDATAFQFKEGGDAAGVTDRLEGVKSWNPLASGKAVVFQRKTGQLVIADGHQRLGLAKRLEQQDDVQLDAFIFKQSDGWTPSQVRALAAKKNIQESTGTALDYARIMRDQPELLDSSVPQNSAKMNHAKGLANLSDDGFGLVINEIVPENHAALVGRLVADTELHVDILRQMAKADLSSEAQARIFIGQALQAGHEELTQMTLFGVETSKLSLLPARTKILTDALKNFKQNKRLLAAINDNAELVKTVGNKIDKTANAEKSLQSAQMAELVEKLASSHGPVSDALRRAAHAMTHDDISVTKARKIFMDDVEELYSKQGLEGLINPRKPDDFEIEPGSPEAEKQGDLLGARFKIADDVDRTIDDVMQQGRQGREKSDESPVELRQNLNDGAVVSELESIIARLPEEVRVVFQTVIKAAEGKTTRGKYDPETDLITIALRNSDPVATLRHEEIHALRSLGFLQGKDWKVLMAAGKKAGYMNEPWGDTGKTRGEVYTETYAHYSNPQELLDQEVVAHLAERRKAGQDLGTEVNTILDKLLNFLRKTSNALRGMGFQTAEDVFARIESGEIGRRTQSVQGHGDSVAYSFAGEKSAFIFYSNLTRGIEAVKQKKAPAKQWAGMISKMSGISRDELQWNGVLDWLAEQKGSVSKADVVQYIKDNEIKLSSQSAGQGIDIKESQTIFDDKTKINAGYEQLFARPNDYGDNGHSIYHANDPKEALFDIDWHPSSKYGQEQIQEALADLELEGFRDSEFIENTQAGGTNYTETTMELVSSRGESFYEQHFGPKNTIAHVRHKDRLTDKGERLLHMEEVQSDWHALGSDTGYTTAKEKLAIDKARKIREAKQYEVRQRIFSFVKEVESASRGISSEVRRGIDDFLYDLDKRDFSVAEKRIDNLSERLTDHPEILQKMEQFVDEKLSVSIPGDGLGGGVPDAPFKGDRWMEMSLKKMLRHAVDNGYDAISWNRGAQIADVSEGSFTDFPAVIEWKSDGKKISLSGVEKAMTLKEIEQGIDAKLAGDIFEGIKANKKSGNVANDANYRLPSEGFRLEYDQKIPRFLNKFTKKWGGKVGYEMLPDFADTNTPNGVLRITDKMRQSVSEGIAYSLEPRRSQDASRQKGESSQNLNRAKTRDTGVPRVGPRGEKYISSGSSDIFENGQLSPMNQMSMRAKTRRTNELGSFVVDDKLDSLGNRLRSLVGLGQRIVAKYPETFKGKPFLDWFGASQVVTQKGEPLILYHSTNADFEVFRPRPGDLGAHFGNSKAANERLAARRKDAKDDKRDYREADQVLPVVLSIKNPLVTKDFMQWHWPTQVVDGLLDQGIIDKKFHERIYQNYRDLEMLYYKAEKSGKSKDELKKFFEARVPAISDLIKQELQRQGYDGIAYTNSVEGKGSKSYIVFDRRQVKSLFNRGTFDGNDPRITYSIDPEEALDGVRKALEEADQALGKGGRSAADQAELDQLAKDAPWEDNPAQSQPGTGQGQSQKLDDFLAAIDQEFLAKSGTESAVRIAQIKARATASGLNDAEIQQAVEQIMRPQPAKKPENLTENQAAPDPEPNFKGTPEEQAAKRAQYIEQKRRAVLTLVAAQRVKADMMRHKNAKGQHDVVQAALSHMENYGTAKHSAIAQKETEILGQAMARMSEFAREFERTKLSGVTPKQKMGLLHDIIRESFGEKTGNLQAEKMAMAWFQTHEGLRGRFNRAGGMIGNMDKWGLPQSHDQMAVSQVKFQDWFDFISPLLDRTKTVHHITGQRMNDQEWQSSLKHIYETIVTNGQNTREPSLQQQGSGALYKQGSEARFLNFRNADDWLKYAEKFGNVSGTHGADLGFHSMMRHLQGFSRDIAAMEILGPNPAAMQNYMRGLIEQELGKTRLGQASALPVDGHDEQGRPFVKKGLRKISHQDYVDKGLKKLDDHFDIARGVLDSPVDQGMANLGKAVRNWEVATKLGSATLSAIGDIATFRAALKFAGMKNQQLILKDIFKYIQAEDRHFAVRSGLILDSSMSMVATESRFGGAVEAATRTGKIADRTLAWSGLGAWTQGIKHAFGMETMANFARVRHLSFDLLDPKMRRLFDNYGLELGQWELLRSFGATEHKGVEFLRGVDISRVIEEARPYLAALRDAEQAGQLEGFMARPQPGRGYFDQLKELLTERQKSGHYDDPDFNVNLRDLSADILSAKQKYMEMIFAETEYAVPTGTIASQAITKKFQAGTPEGETWRLFFQFKAYPISILMMQGGRTMRLVHSEGRAAGAAYAGSTFIAMTLAGGVIGTWLKDLKAGRDPDMDFTSQKNWGRWMAQGGGIGIMGDFLFSDHNRFGGGPLSTFAGPAFGDVEKVLRATAGNVQKLLTGQETSFAKDGLGIVRSNTPGIGSLFYTATAYNRVLLDQMQYLADPAASKSFKRRMKKREKDYGQQYFWPLGETSPSRSPSVSSIGETLSLQ